MPTTYLSREEVEAEETQDPLLHAVRLLQQAGALPVMALLHECSDAPLRRLTAE